MTRMMFKINLAMRLSGLAANAAPSDDRFAGQRVRRSNDWQDAVFVNHAG
jgi:hypothetical protein